MMRFCIAVCGWALLWIITTPWLSVPRCLFWIARCNFWSVSQQTPALIVEPWGKNSTSRTPFVPKHCTHDLPSWSGLLEFRLCWRWSVPPLHELLLQFRGFMRHPCSVPCDYMAQDIFVFLTALCQKVLCTGLLFQFVSFCKHLRHIVCTQFPKLNFIRHNFVKKW